MWPHMANLKATPSEHVALYPAGFVVLTTQAVQKSNSRNCIAIAADREVWTEFGADLDS